MIINIKLNDNSVITIYNVYAIEKDNFELRVRQINQKTFIYSTNNFKVDKIKNIEIVKI